jgi:hypothetical protein
MVPSMLIDKIDTCVYDMSWPIVDNNIFSLKFYSQCYLFVSFIDKKNRLLFATCVVYEDFQRLGEQNIIMFTIYRGI